MWRIVRFLGRFGNFLLFLLLEAIALMVIVNVNKPHREISQGMFLEVSGGMAEAQRSIGSYFNLRTENEKLQQRNAELEAMILSFKDSMDVVLHRRPTSPEYLVLQDSILKDSANFADWKRMEWIDSLMPVSSYRFIPAKAVNNSVDKAYNYITLNKGRAHGIVKDMGLISPKGIAGQVVGVSEHYSIALSVLNKKFRAGAKLLRNPDVGTLVWDGNDPGKAILEFIPQTSIIHIGDTVVTSGYSTVFPRDYVVGTVGAFDTRDQDGFFTVEVNLATNFRGLNNVFLVRHEYKSEIDSLESSMQAQ